jgi:hypothetical protein
MSRRVQYDQKKKALTTIAIDVLIQDGLRTQSIASELHVSGSRCKTLRQQATDRGKAFVRPVGSKPSPQSILQTHVNTIEHTVLLGVYNASIGSLSRATNDKHLTTPKPPMFIPALYSRFVAQMEKLEPILKPIYLAYPRHRMLDINGAWLLLNDYTRDYSWLDTCQDCNMAFAIHQEQRVRTKCPFCALSKEWADR